MKWLWLRFMLKGMTRASLHADRYYTVIFSVEIFDGAEIPPVEQMEWDIDEG